MDQIDGDNDFLEPLKEFTAARIGLGRTGASIPLKQSLAFNLAHAHARDAVYSELDQDKLPDELKEFDLPVLQLHSKAAYREQYLQRPDLGRQLGDESATLLAEYSSASDIVIVIADGLSATAVNNNAVNLLKILIPQLFAAGFKIAPICLVKQGRVAIADDIGSQLRAGLSIIFIGERPGLSAADSMGAYLTFGPKPGLTDESRNCISNIRTHGLSVKQASKKIFYLVQEAFRRKISGVGLKDNEGLPGYQATALH
ncbi:ethanolamine ammonia-lyase subunit EutC [Mucilaginibacter ginsenosidivorans]|uniref:Ethanolamine ammonia-lyase small subunit n=1 Tax=Mucilaginibacter ginsenosidivorans TaxID=398053 RepID=A0A5B8V0Q3_9SPHI|nr:ethanolamine ammonia-lyase subunit EutC [Mucilaginibacter ginsenosidivorans]QEC64126.1 ethanolamine ammonia-lyase subunit EutC [Mucilaginibacter ginsenosidivorans]